MTADRDDPKGASGRLSSLVFACGRFRLSLARPQVMGIVNVTPDSFSDGGRAFAPSAAIAAAERMIGAGADIIDVGAESTRPGAAPVDAAEEWRRLAPVLAGLRDAGRPLSVDTRRPDVMRRALDAGADIVNDIGGFGSPEAVAAIAASTAGAVVMHMQGEPQTMQQAPVYRDVVAQVRQFLRNRVACLLNSGVAADRICVDPGFGFGKSLEHNLALLRSVDRLREDGHPVLVGLSRKSMIGALTGRPVGERTSGSVAAALLAVIGGAAIVRVHDVAETVDALAVWRAVVAGPGDGARADGAPGGDGGPGGSGPASRRPGGQEADSD